MKYLPSSQLSLFYQYLPPPPKRDRRTCLSWLPQPHTQGVPLPSRGTSSGRHHTQGLQPETEEPGPRVRLFRACAHSCSPLTGAGPSAEHRAPQAPYRSQRRSRGRDHETRSVFLTPNGFPALPPSRIMSSRCRGHPITSAFRICVGRS